jgi:hypothetical protein
MANHVEYDHEVRLPVQQNGWQLCFQRCTYHYDEHPSEPGYRFIWRRPNGNLQAARGQARIPSAESLEQLTTMARQAGWF